MKNAKRLLRKLDYLPRWAWYAMSLAIGGPVGPVVVYVAFHALQKPRTTRTPNTTSGARASSGARAAMPTQIAP